MKVSKSSWHYKYLEYCELSIPSSICGYFWKVVFAIVATPFAAGVGLALLPFVAIAKFRFWMKTRENKLVSENKSSVGLFVKQGIANHYGYWQALFAVVVFAVFFNSFHSNSSTNTAIAALLSSFAAAVIMSLVFTFIASMLTLNIVDKYATYIEDDLVGSYMTAVKNRVCPLITFVD